VISDNVVGLGGQLPLGGQEIRWVVCHVNYYNSSNTLLHMEMKHKKYQFNTMI